MAVFVFFAFVVFLLVVLIARSKKENSGNWMKFFAKGKDAGFSIRDMEQLRLLVTNCDIKEPESIFKSQKLFEQIIRSMINSARLSGEINDPPIQDFLSKLFDYFKHIEMETSENKIRISTSRQIKEGQTLRILVPGTGVYKSEVVKNSEGSLAISRPVNPKQTSAMQWEGIRLSIYFWREDDAGYVFDSEVIDEVFSKGISSLKIEHNDSLFRTQKRKSLRINFRKMAFLYLIDESDNPHHLERTAGLRCMLDDISDSGCAYRVNGEATVGMRLKVQFSIDRIPICMPGTVRSVEFNSKANTSLVRMEADTLPNATRNHILCEVFNMMPEEDDEELPFRVLEEEAEAVISKSANDDPSKRFEELIDV